MPAKVPAFLLNRTLRFFSLRIVWVAAIVNVGATSYYLLCPGSSRSIALHFLLVTPPVAIAFLHLLEAFFGMPWLTYFLLELVEISCLVVILTGGYRASVSWQYQPTDFWLRISTYHILIVFISLLVLIRLAWLVDGWPRGANLLSRMDIRKKRYEGRSTSIKSSASIPDIEKVGRKKNFQSFLALSAGALAGRSIWRKQIAGEPRPFALLRGVVSVIFLALIVGFLFFIAIMEPIQDQAMSPSKMLLMKAIPWGMPPLTEDNKWVVRVKQPATKDNTMYALNDAVKVYPLWETNGQPSSTSQSNRRSPPVSVEKRQFGGGYSTLPMPSQPGTPSSAPTRPSASTTSEPQRSSTSSAPVATPTTSGSTLPLVSGAPPCIPIASSLPSVTFECAARQQIPKEQLLNALDTDNSDILDNAFPDLLVVVDFAALDKAIEQAPTAVSQVSVRHHSVHVALALTDNVDEINEFIPVTLVPGMNLLGITDLIMRRRSTQPVLSTIGWPDLFNTSMAAELAYVVNDPHAALFDLPPGPNIATIRFSARNKATTWRVKQDAREKSVLSGLSSVGGLGSLLGTIFVFLFGSSLLGIMFGTKPLSPFGALHNFCSNIAERYQQRYTSMRTDIEKIYAERGVMKYLLDVLIDLDLIAKAIIVEDSGPGSDDFEIEVVSPVNEVESDNEVEDGVSHPPSASQPLMSESLRPS